MIPASDGLMAKSKVMFFFGIPKKESGALTLEGTLIFRIGHTMVNLRKFEHILGMRKAGTPPLYHRTSVMRARFCWYIIVK